MRRLHAVRLYEAAVELGRLAGRKETAVTTAVLPLLVVLGLPRCSRTTLAGWRRSYRADGLAGLADLRGADRDRWRLYGPFFAELERVYTARLIRKAVAHELARATAAVTGWAVPRLRDSERFIDKYIRPGVTAERGGTFDGGSNRASNDNRGS